MKKLKFLWLAALLLALLFTGCGGGDDGDSDTWHDITSSSQLDGTWKGSISATKSMKEWIQIWEWEWTAAEIDDFFGNMSLKITYDIALNISSGHVTGTDKWTYAYSGGTINTTWEEIKSWYTSVDSVNDSNHSLIFNDDISFTYEEGDDDIQINQDGRKLKYDFDLDGVPMDMIMTKQ